MMGPAIIHERKEYVSHFNLPSKLIQHMSSLNKIILVGSDSLMYINHLKIDAEYTHEG